MAPLPPGGSDHAFAGGVGAIANPECGKGSTTGPSGLPARAIFEKPLRHLINTFAVHNKITLADRRRLRSVALQYRQPAHAQ